jgi:hypothetical protein
MITRLVRELARWECSMEVNVEKKYGEKKSQMSIAKKKG